PQDRPEQEAAHHRHRNHRRRPQGHQDDRHLRDRRQAPDGLLLPRARHAPDGVFHVREVGPHPRHLQARQVTMNRRDFFHPRRLARTAGHVAAALEEPAPTPAQPEALTLVRFARRAMATTFEIAVPLTDSAAGLQARLAEALHLIDRLEAQLTVFRDDSDMSRINRHAADGAMPVEPRLFDLLELAARIHAETGGAYDIAGGALIKAWGVFRRVGRRPP